MTRLIPVAILVALTAPSAALAGKIDDRREWQAERIEQGRNDGSITWTEGIKLRAEQRRIARTEDRLRADGHLSAADRRAINDMQNVATRNIKSQSNDGWHRLFGLPRVGK